MGNKCISCSASTIIISSSVEEESSLTTSSVIVSAVTTTVEVSTNATTVLISILCEDNLLEILQYLNVHDVLHVVLTQTSWKKPGLHRLPSSGSPLRIPQDICIRKGLEMFSINFEEKGWTCLKISKGTFNLNKEFIGSKFDFIENSSIVTGCRAVYRRQLNIVTSGITIEGTMDPISGQILTQLEGQINIKEARDISISNIRVRAPTSDGYVIERKGDAKLIHCEAMYCGQSGLCVRTGGRVDTLNCNFSSNLCDGVCALNKGSWVRVKHSKVSQNGKDGVFIGQKAYGDISDSICSNNKQYGVCASENGLILLHDSPNCAVVIENNWQGDQGSQLGGNCVEYTESYSVQVPGSICVRLHGLIESDGLQSHLQYLNGRTGTRGKWNRYKKGFHVTIDGTNGITVVVKPRNLILIKIDELHTIRYNLKCQHGDGQGLMRDVIPSSPYMFQLVG